MKDSYGFLIPKPQSADSVETQALKAIAYNVAMQGQVLIDAMKDFKEILVLPEDAPLPPDAPDNYPPE